ncbi:hypothetical protein PR048_005000 [Dryococelus australis]|uniref:Uncharacterized protein n=1 Tax=Dryococelus australis TaxID=614101 RepID=A0ABQ9I835_9NEOP|nr:hypothetical protein PR048_005000 [Dryococelus australis]
MFRLQQARSGAAVTRYHSHETCFYTRRVTGNVRAIWKSIPERGRRTFALQEELGNNLHCHMYSAFVLALACCGILHLSHTAMEQVELSDDKEAMESTCSEYWEMAMVSCLRLENMLFTQIHCSNACRSLRKQTDLIAPALLPRHHPPTASTYTVGGRGGVAVRQLSSQQGEPGSTFDEFDPGFSHLGIVADDAAGRWVISGISCFPHNCIPAPIHIHLVSPASALKTSLLKAAQIYAIHAQNNDFALKPSVQAVSAKQGGWKKGGEEVAVRDEEKEGIGPGTEKEVLSRDITPKLASVLRRYTRALLGAAGIADNLIGLCWDCWEQWKREGAQILRIGSARTRRTTKRKVRLIAREARTAPEASSAIPVRTRVTTKVRYTPGQRLARSGDGVLDEHGSVAIIASACLRRHTREKQLQSTPPSGLFANLRFVVLGKEE